MGDEVDTGALATAPGDGPSDARASRRMEPTQPAVVAVTDPGAGSSLFFEQDLVAGIYEIERLLGEGGMGQVYAARDRLLNRRVAIKTLRGGVESAQLRREGEALAAIRHPGVLTVHAMGRHRDVDFLVMELVSGMTLAQYAARRREAMDPLSVLEAVEILLAVTDALSAVHGAGIAHGDVKPENVLLAAAGRVVLADFGLVAQEGLAHRARQVLGTPTYMAPEVITGDLQRGGAHLADLYAVGVMAFELLTGVAPFVAESVPELLREHLVAQAPDVSRFRAEVPAALAQLVGRLLAKQPESRPLGEVVVWQLRSIRRELDDRPRAPARVVVVDDDAMTARLLAACARSASRDAVVEIASDAAEALRLLRRNPASLLILDLRLPGMSGVELCMYLRGSPLAGPCPIIAVSATAGAEDAQLLRQLGVSHCIPKDAELLPHLAEAVRAALG